MITEIKSDEPISIDGILTTVEVEQQKFYNQALEDLQKMIDYEYYDGGYGDYHEVEMIARMIEQLRK